MYFVGTELATAKVVARKNTKLISFIENTGCDFHCALSFACFLGHHEFATWLFNNINYEGEYHWYLNEAFWRACHSGNIELVLLLLTKIKTIPTHELNTCLYMACKDNLNVDYSDEAYWDEESEQVWVRPKNKVSNNRLKIVLLLIEKGADEDLQKGALSKENCIDLYHRGVRDYKHQNFPNIISSYVKNREYILLQYKGLFIAYLIKKFI